jgi:hypothetical protein
MLKIRTNERTMQLYNYHCDHCQNPREDLDMQANETAREDVGTEHVSPDRPVTSDTPRARVSSGRLTTCSRGV